jgi:hypothetical protein
MDTQLLYTVLGAYVVQLEVNKLRVAELQQEVKELKQQLVQEDEKKEPTLPIDMNEH